MKGNSLGAPRLAANIRCRGEYTLSYNNIRCRKHIRCRTGPGPLYDCVEQYSINTGKAVSCYFSKHKVPPQKLKIGPDLSPDYSSVR